MSDRAAFRRSLEHVLRWDFERILPVTETFSSTVAALREAWLR